MCSVSEVTICLQTAVSNNNNQANNIKFVTLDVGASKRKISQLYCIILLELLIFQKK